jgi:glycosyltransferase involved in cell wall biosynthesis
MNTSAPTPKVTVCILAFNHSKYIEECIDSIFSQVTTFCFEVIVCDDESKDGTWEILKGCVKKYGDGIRIFRNEKNIGATQSYINIHSMARGDYVAHIDGDDYALQGKLQAQHDVLEMHKNCNVVMHPMDILEPNGKIRPSNQVIENNKYWVFTRNEFVRFTWIGAHSSKMYRRGFDHNKLPKRCIDFLMTFYELENGCGYFICDKAYGVYREGVGISTKSYWTRYTLIEHLIYIHSKYVEYRDEVCSAFFYLVMSDLKNRSNTILSTLLGLIRSFSILGCQKFFKNASRYVGNRM